MIVYQAGNLWTGARATSTDKMLVTALAATTPVLWVDPPAPRAALERQRESEGRAEPGVDHVAPGVLRLRTSALPGFSRPGVRDVARRLHRHRVAREVAGSGAVPTCFVLANAMHAFPRFAAAQVTKVLYLTDDWIAGADLLGLDPRYVARSVAAATAQADVVLAVSPALLEVVAPWAGPQTSLQTLPSGCTVAPAEALGPRPPDLPDQPFAVLAGSVNERIDLDRIEALTGADVPVVVIGGRIDRDPGFARRFDALVARPGVTYLGRREQQQLPAYLAAASVGLTPYTDTGFNRSSFPLKTLDYLAAGTPVVSTDLPASRWFGTDLVQVSTTVADFVSRVQAALASPRTEAVAARCRAFAAGHSWTDRVHTFRDLVVGAEAVAARPTVSPSVA